MSTIRILSVVSVFCALASAAVAQNTPAPTNPLRPGSTRTAPAATPAPTQTQAPATTEAPKAKRARSPAQLANDQRMRDCGSEWRTNKAALQAQGKTWKVFNVECRARLKAQGR